jgi:hypothetical protein
MREGKERVRFAAKRVISNRVGIRSMEEDDPASPVTGSGNYQQG